MKAATHPDKIWWTAREIAGARLPDMPSTRQGLEVLTKRLGWRSDPKKARQRSGVSRLMAVDQVAQLRGVSDRTIWNWLKMVDGVAESDRLCHLAPRNRSAERSDKKAECSPEFFERLKGDCLRLERPSFASCYRRTVRWCRAKGKSYLPNRTARRRLNELVARVTQVFGKRRLAGDTARAANTDEVLISNYNLGRD